MDFTEVMAILEQYGFKGFVVMLSIFILTTTIKSKWFRNLLAKISDAFIDKFMKTKADSESGVVKNITESDISNHDIFNYIDFCMYSRIPIFKFSTDYRTIVFRKYLTIYLESYKDNLFKYITSKEYQVMDDAMLSTSLLGLINNVIFEYEKNAVRAGIPDIIIEKMKVKNNDTIKLTRDLLEGICSSGFYSSELNLLKIYSILNIILSILENTISGSESVCNSINGQLKGLSFEGKIEP